VGRIIAVVVVIMSSLLIWKGGVLNAVHPQRGSATADPGPVIARSGDAMRGLKSVKLSLVGTFVIPDLGGAQLTGSGELTYPHEEKLSLQIRIPSKVPGESDQIVAMNERIEKGRTLVQIPAQGPAWKDVTGKQSQQFAPGLDPIANLSFVNAFRASDDLGTMSMDGIPVYHFSLNVDAGRYVQQLKADPNSGITPADEASLGSASIQVEVWISTSDLYLHQMKISMATRDYTWNVTYHYSDFVKGGGAASA
jgi:hypothetical protein